METSSIRHGGGDAQAPDTITLVDGAAWVELRPLAGTVAQVVGGNLQRRHELVMRPAGVDWERAAEPVARRLTRVSPHDLRTMYDVVVDWIAGDRPHVSLA